MEEVAKIRAKRQVNNVLSQQNSPNTTLIHGLPLNLEVLVWREGNTSQSGKWTSPYTLLTLKGETCKV